MDLEQAFLGSIREDSDDPSLWLILADWLDERDDPRAELVRLTQALRHEPDHADFDLRQRRVQALLAGGMKPLVPTFSNSVGMEFALIPAGSFVMGSPETEAERRPHEPLRRVRFRRPIYLGVHLVTQAQYRRVTGANPSQFSGDDHPVDSVNWHAAAAFCDRLSKSPTEMAAGRKYRLPTSAEWEYACRAGTRTVFHFGDAIGAAHANFNSTSPYGGTPSQESRGRTVPVGSYPPNAWGLCDLHGNVAEWARDWFRDQLSTREETDPSGPRDGSLRVVRGGAWCFHGCYCRAAYRNNSSPDSAQPYYGFRVACLSA